MLQLQESANPSEYLAHYRQYKARCASETQAMLLKLVYSPLSDVVWHGATYFPCPPCTHTYTHTHTPTHTHTHTPTHTNTHTNTRTMQWIQHNNPGGTHTHTPTHTHTHTHTRTHTHTHRRRTRRCGPPVGRTRGTSPWCPPALIGLAGDREGGSVPTRPAKHHGGGSPLRLLPLSPGPHNVHALPPYTLPDPPRGTGWGARRSAGSTSGTVHHPPKGRGT